MRCYILENRRLLYPALRVFHVTAKFAVSPSLCSFLELDMAMLLHLMDYDNPAYCMQIIAVVSGMLTSL